MPHASVKLIPGVNAEQTPALNSAGISTSNLVRFRDGLIEKLGGWQKFFGGQTPTPIRALLGWQDLNNIAYLAIGAEGSLAYVTGGNGNDITPQTLVEDITPDFDTTNLSPIVVVNDVGSDVNVYDTVFFATQVSVGGIILQGAYPITASLGTDSYSITADDAATATVSAGGTVPVFDTTSGLFTVEVTLADHGHSVGDTAAFLMPTSVGGLTISGLYTVTAVNSPSVFVINTPFEASSTATVSMNGGNARLIYYVAVGPPPPGTGYGILGYGEGGYGTGTPQPPRTGNPITATDWTLDNWGQVLLACPAGGPIYQWSPDAGFRTATMVSTAPTANGGIFIAMPQQILVAWAASTLDVSDPLLVRWSHVADYSEWTVSAVTQAGSYRIPRGSKIIGGCQGPQQALIWTDLAVWAMQYVGPPFIYGFNEIGTGCGLIGSKAMANLGPATYWMSQKAFFVLQSGGGVREVPCSVWDVVFQNLDTANVSKIRAAPNSQFNEVTWYYPPAGGNGEPTAYVKYNIGLRTWDYGTLDRTAWIDQSVLGSPIGAGTDGYVYQHETSPDADTQAMMPSMRTGYFALSEGLDLPFVDWVLPDFKFGYFGGDQDATVLITFFVVDYPGDTPRTYGPYAVTQSVPYINTRFRGRLIAIQIESQDFGSFWRIGNIRFRVAPDGRR
ncbi:hypothetical protein OIU35_31525 [Boseaceae bacterium BT-24-1]|nr:hypothetical protein [Boseaceae bacterium BT-24-1]